MGRGVFVMRDVQRERGWLPGQTKGAVFAIAGRAGRRGRAVRELLRGLEVVAHGARLTPDGLGC